MVTAESVQAEKVLWRQPLWDFSCSLYESEKLKTLLHRLQDEYGANINIIFWCVWLEVNEIDISKETIDDVLIAVDSVSQTTASKVRELRKHIKSTELFTRVQTKMICKHLSGAELLIEKILIQRLQDLSERFAEVMPDSFDPMSLEFYLEFLGIPASYEKARGIVNYCQNNMS